MSAHPTIKMRTCKSSQVKAFGYDPDSKTMAVQFSSGTYHYADVPQDVFDQMSEHESVGRFIAQAVKGKFEYSKVA